MSGWEQSAVSLAVFLPAAGAAVIALTPSRDERLLRSLGIVFSGAALAVGIAILSGFDVRYHVGVDGISLPLLELTLLLSFLCAVYSYRVIPEPGKTRGFLALMLVLETGMAGTFV